MLALVQTSQFRRDLKKAIKRSRDLVHCRVWICGYQSYGLDVVCFDSRQLIRRYRYSLMSTA